MQSWLQKRVPILSLTYQGSECQSCFDLKAVCSFLNCEICNVGEADGSGSAIPLPPNSISQLDIKSCGVKAGSSFLPAKWTLSGMSDNSLYPDKECADGEADGSGRAIPLPLEACSSQDVRTSFANISLHPKLGLLLKSNTNCKGSCILLEYDSISNGLVPYLLKDRMENSEHNNHVFIECTTFPRG